MRASLRPSAHLLAPAILGASLLPVYLATLAPGLSWANYGSDGGDLITAAATGGVPHPTGYPLYLVLARLFQLLPVGSLAFRTNLMSALATVGAALAVYAIVVAFASGARHSWLAGLASGYAFGLAPLVWSQALITEVYALQSLLVALLLALYAREPRNFPPGILDGLRGGLLGLAMGNHLTTLLFVPAALLVGSLRRTERTHAASERSPGKSLEFDRAALLRQLLGFAAGLSIYLILPLRAAAQPPVNWGNVVTLDRLWWLVSGQLYQSYYLGASWLEAGPRLQEMAALLLRQFGAPAVLLGLAGLVVFWNPSRLHSLTIWIAVTQTGFTLLYSSGDAQLYLIPAFLCFAIWIGMGLSGLMRQFNPRSSLATVALFLLVPGYFAVRSLAAWSQVDASHDLRAEAFGREILSAAPRGAILFAEGDEAVFALWYFHFALGERPDVVVAAQDLVHFGWYEECLRDTYPAIQIPGPLPWPETIAGANPSRVVCYVRYDGQTEMDCSGP